MTKLKQLPVARYKDWAQLVVGNEALVPTNCNKYVRYVNLDNAASTPAFKQVKVAVFEFLNWYSNIHRGEGYKSRYSTAMYEKSREEVARFLGLNTETNTVIFVKNTTEAINKLANSLSFSDQDIVISTFMEHHSNDLPWRKQAKVIYAKVLSDGTLDYENISQLFEQYSGQVRLLAVTGASNVTGIVNNIGYLAELAHKHGAEIMVDAAQLVPHRKINMLPDTHPQHIDYLVFSAHKMYAPFGVGVLAGKKAAFESSEPDYVGGGTITMVSHEQVYWADVPAKEEAGTPNIIGVVALSSAIKQFEVLGMEQIEAYENYLTDYFLSKVAQIPEIRLYGPESFKLSKDRLGVFSFSVNGMDHALVAARLSREAGIGVRNGCFCAHPYVLSLLNIPREEQKKFQEQIRNGNKQGIPGLVRVSFGLYNTTAEIDYLIESVNYMLRTPHKNDNYVQDGFILYKN